MEETLKRVGSHPGASWQTGNNSRALVLFDGRRCSGVQGLVVVNADGIPIRTTMDHDSSVQARRLSGWLTASAQSYTVRGAGLALHRQSAGRAAPAAAAGCDVRRGACAVVSELLFGLTLVPPE